MCQSNVVPCEPTLFNLTSHQQTPKLVVDNFVKSFIEIK